MRPNRIPRNALTALVVTGAMLLAGCAGLTAEASIDYDGASNGSHSDKADCDADGSITGSGDITDGSVQVTVEDADGTEMFTRTFSGSFDLDKTDLDGDAGTWTLEAVRRGDDLAGDEFNGEYEFHLDCSSIVSNISG